MMFYCNYFRNDNNQCDRNDLNLTGTRGYDEHEISGIRERPKLGDGARARFSSAMVLMHDSAIKIHWQIRFVWEIIVNLRINQNAKKKRETKKKNTFTRKNYDE